MTYHKLIANFSVCLSLLYCASTYAQKAPDFDLPGENSNISLEDLKGKVVYLDFWASWCDPCRKSFPWMNDIQARYKDDNFTVVAINLDTSREDAKKFLAVVPADFNVAYDPSGKVAEKYQLKAMPSSYLIDKNGKLVYAHRGYREGDTNEIEKKIRHLINSK